MFFCRPRRNQSYAAVQSGCFFLCKALFVRPRQKDAFVRPSVLPGICMTMHTCIYRYIYDSMYMYIYIYMYIHVILVFAGEAPPLGMTGF